MKQTENEYADTINKILKIMIDEDYSVEEGEILFYMCWRRMCRIKDFLWNMDEVNDTFDMYWKTAPKGEGQEIA